MIQMSFLEPTTTEIEIKIERLEASIDKIRKSTFARLDAMGKEYQFLYDNMELIKDLVELLKRREGYETFYNQNLAHIGA